MVTRGERLHYDGEVYRLLCPERGVALRSAAPPVEVPIYVASPGPANLRLTVPLADGWIGTRSSAKAQGSSLTRSLLGGTGGQSIEIST